MKDLGATARGIDDAISAYEEMADGIVPIDKEAAGAAWHLSRSSGRRIPLVDSLIAGASGRIGRWCIEARTWLRFPPVCLRRSLSDRRPEVRAVAPGAVVLDGAQ